MTNNADQFTCQGECCSNPTWWFATKSQHPKLHLWMEENREAHLELVMVAAANSVEMAPAILMKAQRMYHEWLDKKSRELVTGETLLQELSSRIKGISDDTPAVNEENSNSFTPPEGAKKLTFDSIPGFIKRTMPPELLELLKNGDIDIYGV